jgi:hypothetical protein
MTLSCGEFSRESRSNSDGNYLLSKSILYITWKGWWSEDAGRVGRVCWTLPAPRVVGNPADVIWPRSRNFVYNHHFLPLTEPSHVRLRILIVIYNMASTNVPRAALRSLSRTTPSFRSTAPRVATRCLHQKASPITASPLQRRPKTQQWSQNAAPILSSVSRRTMFIQTEPTPNADVCASTISAQASR